jgi:hypothetical protein
MISPHGEEREVERGEDGILQINENSGSFIKKKVPGG